MATKTITVDNDSKIVAPDANSYLPYLPEHLHAAFLESLNDVQLTSLRRQMALNEARVKQLLLNLDREVLSEMEIMQQLKAQFPGLKDDLYPKLTKFIQTFLPENFIDHRTFKRLEALVVKHESALADRRLRESDAALKTLFEQIRRGRSTGAIWDQIHESLEQQRRLAEAEERRLNATAQTMAMDKVVMLLGFTISALRDGVMKYVQDREQQEYILEHAERVYAAQFGAGTDSKKDRRALDGESQR